MTAPAGAGPGWGHIDGGGIWSPRFDRLPEEKLPPVWSELVQREVTTRSLEVWRIDDAEYVRMRGRDDRPK